MIIYLFALFLLVECDFRHTLFQHSRIFYFTELRVKAQTFNVIVDFEASYSFLMDSSCTSCPATSNKYVKTSSYTVFKPEITQQFANIAISGEGGEDEFSLEHNVFKLKFIRALKVEPFGFEYDGVLSFNPSEFSLVDALVKEGIISEPKVSFYFSPSPLRSFIDFGKPDAEIIGDKKPAVLDNIERGIGFKAKSGAITSKDSSSSPFVLDKDIYFSSISNLTLIPRNDFFLIKDRLIKKRNICQYTDSYRYFTCSCSSFPSDTFNSIEFETKSLQKVAFPSYSFTGLMSISLYSTENCVLAMRLTYPKTNSEDHWRLPSTLLHQYYTVFDTKANKLSLYNLNRGEDNEIPVDIFNYILSGIAIFVIVAGTIYICCKRRVEEYFIRMRQNKA